MSQSSINSPLEDRQIFDQVTEPRDQDCSGPSTCTDCWISFSVTVLCAHYNR